MYEFNYLDRVGVRGVEGEGYIADRKVSFFNFLPFSIGFKNYYTVRMEELVLDSESPRFDWIEIECPESDLVRRFSWDKSKSLKQLLIGLGALK